MDNEISVAEKTLNHIKQEAAKIQYENKNKLILYHGSKLGLEGEIKPSSREECDFGKGFYMTNNPVQSLNIIASYEEAKLYIVSLDVTDLNRKEIIDPLDCSMTVAYNRRKMKPVEGRLLYQRCKEMTTSYDLLIGDIVDDRIFYALDNFYEGYISDAALVNCISELHLSKQIVAKTKKACEQVKVEKEISLSWKKREIIRKISEENRNVALGLTKEIIKKYRRRGKYFDEILEGVK